MTLDSLHTCSSRQHAGWGRSLLLTGATALVLAVGLIFAGCAKNSGAAPQGGPGAAAPPSPVTVAKAARKDMPVEVRVIGAVEAYSMVTIKSRVPGQIVKVGFTQGQDVKKGDLLFQIDRRPFEAALASAKANLARDTATARNAREEAVFQADIFKRSAGTQRELDKSAAMAEAAEAQVAADQAAIRTAEIQLDYTTIVSPLDGRTGDLMAHEGSIVKADDTSLVEINQVSPIYVTFSVAETYLPRIRQYMATSEKPLAVDATIPQADLPAERGGLTFVDNQVDKTTGMIQLKGTFANANRLLWPGQFVNVALVLTSQPDAVVVPSQAIQTSQQGRFLFVVRPDNTVESRPVDTGVTWNDLTVVAKGIAADETVVTDGQLRLVPGARIVVKNAASQPAPSMAVAKAEDQRVP